MFFEILSGKIKQQVRHCTVILPLFAQAPAEVRFVHTGTAGGSVKFLPTVYISPEKRNLQELASYF